MYKRSTPHNHKEQKCPNGRHGWCPPKEGDSRSVCPALNTMANHGYLPRSGRHITLPILIHALCECYNLTFALAFVLATGGYLLVRKIPIPIPVLLPIAFSFEIPLLFGFSLHFFTFGLFGNFFGDGGAIGGTKLKAFDRHNGVEHDASLVHRDCPAGEEYPSHHIIQDWVKDLISDVRPIPKRAPASAEAGEWAFLNDPVMDEDDVARARVRRERLSPKLDCVHAEIARGEMAIILGVWSRASTSSEGETEKSGAPLAWMLDWLKYERLPDDWKPNHRQTLVDVIHRSKKMRLAMEGFRDEEQRDLMN